MSKLSLSSPRRKLRDSLHFDSELCDVEIGGKTLIMRAVEQQNTDVLKQLLIQKTSEINKKDDGGSTALLYASKTGLAECLEVLIINGADVNIPDSDDKSPLMWASKKGRLECVKLLLDHGANINVRDDKGETALIYASRGGYFDVIQLLLQYKADVNLMNEKSCSALTWASRNDHQNCVKLLIENGATVDTEGEGSTPLIYSYIYQSISSDPQVQQNQNMPEAITRMSTKRTDSFRSK
jgi:ankyrin repeat protein